MGVQCLKLTEIIYLLASRSYGTAFVNVTVVDSILIWKN